MEYPRYPSALTKKRPYLHAYLEHLHLKKCILNSVMLITTFQKNMLSIFSDIAENRLDVLIDDLIIFENSYYFNQILVQRKKK